jgi:hypothetical protein
MKSSDFWATCNYSSYGTVYGHCVINRQSVVEMDEYGPSSSSGRMDGFYLPHSPTDTLVFRSLVQPCVVRNITNPAYHLSTYSLHSKQSGKKT